MGKKSGVRISVAPKYFFARSPSNTPYAAFAGSDQGGLFPLATLIPPKNTGWNLSRKSRVEKQTSGKFRMSNALDFYTMRSQSLAFLE